MKRCPSCERDLPTSAFNRKSRTKDGLRVNCKDCDREASRRYYKQNPDGYKRRAGAQRAKLRAEHRAEIERLRREGKCAVCGEDEDCVLDFHHVEPGQPVTRVQGTSRAAFARELAKCVLICANCHRRVHAGKVVLDPSTRRVLG